MRWNRLAMRMIEQIRRAVKQAKRGAVGDDEILRGLKLEREGVGVGVGGGGGWVVVGTTEYLFDAGKRTWKIIGYHYKAV